MMTVRFIDTDLINKRWYRELEPEYKVLWIHLTLMCDHAGILDVDIPMWNVRIGSDIQFTEEEILEVFSDKIYAYKKHKWWLIDFIDFQQRNNKVRIALKEGTNYTFHNSILNRLKKEGLTESFLNPLTNPSMEGSRKSPSTSTSTSTSKELYSEDKANEKKEVRKLELKRNLEQFELLWIEYPNKSGKKPSGDKYKVLMPDEDLFNKIYADIVERSKSFKWREEDGKYVPHLKTYLNQERWNDDMLPVDAPAVERGSGSSRAPYIEDEEDD